MALWEEFEAGLMDWEAEPEAWGEESRAATSEEGLGGIVQAVPVLLGALA